jgi:hypothetical protein
LTVFAAYWSKLLFYAANWSKLLIFCCKLVKIAHFLLQIGQNCSFMLQIGQNCSFFAAYWSKLIIFAANWSKLIIFCCKLVKIAENSHLSIVPRLQSNTLTKRRKRLKRTALALHPPALQRTVKPFNHSQSLLCANGCIDTAIYLIFLRKSGAG